MLTHLHISNYALIQNLELRPSSQFNTITGETGAGKSIMLGALGLLMGNRADTKILMNDDAKCTVEGAFNVSDYNLKDIFKSLDIDYEEETIIRREINAQGKSRAFINDSPVNLDALKQLTSRLIDIHSQHDTLLLGEGDFQIRVIDVYADTAKEFSNYQNAYKSYKETKQKLDALKQNLLNANKDSDYKQHLLKELVEVNLSDESEQEKLEEELKWFENAEEIKSKIAQIIFIGQDSENSVSNMLREAQQIISGLTKFSSDIEAEQKRMESAMYELQDIFNELSRRADAMEFDAEKIDLIRKRLDTFHNLQYKHKVQSLKDLINIKNNLEDELKNSENTEGNIENLEKEISALMLKLQEQGKILSKKRQKYFPDLIKKMEENLSSLGMPHAKIEIKSVSAEPDWSGMDKIEILFSANKGVKPQPLKQVASGGEFSRLMFVIKHLLADKIALPTLIFDEIDTGVSGEIAIKMAKMMRNIANNHQVFTITHLPQVAALGNEHYYVYKQETADKSFTSIKALSPKEREFEIAKMISGDNPSPVAFENARELLSLNA